jgi:hypothetical protein
MTVGPPPSLRGRLRSLSTLSTFSSQTQAVPQRRPNPNRAGQRAQGKAVIAPRPIAPRTELPSLGSMSVPNVRPRASTPAAAAIARYIAERETKRARGLAGILPHEAFDGRPGEFTFVGRRQVDGHTLLLLRDSTKIIVLRAQEQAATLHSGDRITLTADGRIGNHNHGRQR